MKHGVTGTRLFSKQAFSSVLLSVLVLLGGCSSTGSGQKYQSDSRYTMSQDAPPSGDYDVSGLEDAVPRAEPYSRGGNRSPYTVWGKSYNVLDSSHGYVETGTASWYGAKFHGHKTSNGETYDMYAMSAAHKNLPIPSFVEVTNLDNNRRVIVRVNDRGPFHSDRIIDLSYAAAKKLDFTNKGTARVRIAAITVSADGSWTVAGKDQRRVATTDMDTASRSGTARTVSAGQPGGRPYVQVGAFRSLQSAAALRLQISEITQAPVHVVEAANDAAGWHRVHVGPFDSRSRAETERDRIEARQLGQPIVVMRDDDR